MKGSINDTELDPVYVIIRQLRIAMHLSQSRLADAIDRDQYVISRIEQGLHSPTPEEYRALARVFGVEPGYFFGDSSYSREDEKADTKSYILGYVVENLNSIKEFIESHISH